MSMTDAGEAQVLAGDDESQVNGLMALLNGKEQPIEGPSEDRVDDPDRDEPQEKRVESNTDVDEPEDKAEPKEKAAASLDDFIEIPGEDGAEPTKIAVKDAIESHKQWHALEAQKEQIVERVETEARTRAQGMSQRAEQEMTNIRHHLDAVLQIIQPPQPPSSQMLVPGSQYYNPDQYHLERANYEQAMTRFNQVRQQADTLANGAKQLEQRRNAENSDVEWAKLQRAYPEFADPAKAEATRSMLVSELGKHYKVTPEKLNGITNHEFFLIARDAIAYKNLKRDAPTTQKKIEARATVTKPKQEARADRDRDSTGKYQSDAYSRFQKSKSDDDAAAVFQGLFKAKRTAR